VDGSEIAIEMLQKRMNEENLSCRSTVCNVMHLPFSDDFFDAVVDIQCLSSNTITDIHSIIQEVHRVLKTNGKFYSQFFGKKTSPHTLDKEITFHFTDTKEIQQLFSLFSSLQIEYIERTKNNMKDTIQEYIIIATK
jgi:ubiquinone/menaquinone biosynthesis C-methylase UbiE